MGGSSYRQGQSFHGRRNDLGAVIELYNNNRHVQLRFKCPSAIRFDTKV